MLQKYLFIPLDIFRKNRHNVNIRVKRDAWLTLFSSDDPDAIIELIEEYPEFRQIYEEAYGICLNVERVMDMFSKELYEMDKNTTQYMIDEMQGTIDKQDQKIDEMQGTIDEMREEHTRAIDEMREEHTRAIDEMQEEHTRAINEMQEEHTRAIDEMQKEHAKERNEMLRQGIRNTVKILQDLKMSEQEIRTRICEQNQISEEQVGEFFN